MTSLRSRTRIPLIGRQGRAARSCSMPLERRGRRWIFGSFVFCPCHLPLTLGVLATVSGGTVVGALLRDHALVAGAVITTAWVAGTWRGFRLVRVAQRASSVPTGTSGRSIGDLRLSPGGGRCVPVDAGGSPEDRRSRS